MIRTTEHWPKREWRIRILNTTFVLTSSRTYDVESLEIIEFMADANQGNKPYKRKAYILLDKDRQYTWHFKRGKIEGLKALLEYFKRSTSQSSTSSQQRGKSSDTRGNR